MSKYLHNSSLTSHHLFPYTRYLSTPALAAFLILVLATTAWPASARTLTEEERAVKQADLEHLKNRINKLQSGLKTVLGKKNSIQAELRKAEKAIGEIGRRLYPLEKRLAAQKKKIRRLQKQKEKYRADFAIQKRALARQMRTAYVTGRQEYLKMILNQQDPMKMSRTLAYYDYLNQARTRRIKLIKGYVKSINKVERAIITEKNKLEKTRNVHLKEKNSLQAEQRSRKQVLLKLSGDIKSKKQLLENYRIDKQQLEKLLKDLQDVIEELPMAIAPAQPFGKLKGKLPWPVHGRIVVPFGKSRRVGKLRWQGVVIRAREGRNVRAVSHGRVVFADWLRGFGQMMIIDHGQGYMSLYGYNQSFHKQPGDWVEAGETIASVGNSGGQKKAALYFEIRRNGKPTNPKRWCKNVRRK